MLKRLFMPSPPSKSKQSRKGSRTPTADDPATTMNAQTGEDLDPEVLYNQKFVLQQQSKRLREELAQKRFAELSLSNQVEALGEDVERLETELAGRTDALMECVERLHEHEVLVMQLRQENEEAVEMVQLAARAAGLNADGSSRRKPTLMDLLRCRGGGSKVGGVPTSFYMDKELSVWVRLAPVLLLLGIFFLFSYVQWYGGRGVLGGLLFSSTSPFWRSRPSGLTHLVPGGFALGPGEYMQSCPRWGIRQCPKPLFLWMQEDGNLVLYRGYSPMHHGGPVWSIHPVNEYSLAATGRRRQGGKVKALVDEQNVLKLVHTFQGGAEVVLFGRSLDKLPRALFPFPFQEEAAGSSWFF